MRRPLILTVLAFLVLFFGPVAWRTAWFYRTSGAAWWSADRSSAGLLLTPAKNPDALVRVYSARTVSWRGIFAVHSWLVLKDKDAPSYQRWDLTAWGDPIRMNGFDPDGRWFGETPQLVYAADGDRAANLIPRMRAAIETYRFRHRGDYRAWPGPNSNTFVATVMAAVPAIDQPLPPTAIGKDYPVDGRWIGLTPSHTGVRLTLGGYAGITIGWVEGVELNILGGVIGIDLRRPALKLPGVGRIGL